MHIVAKKILPGKIDLEAHDHHSCNKAGISEYWKAGNYLPLHYSIIPLFQVHSCRYADRGCYTVFLLILVYYFGQECSMQSFQTDDFHINLNKEGSRRFFKASYPLRFGRLSEILTPDYLFQFNLNGEIKFITGRRDGWPDPSEYLKRTVANDWIYYSTGGYSGVYDLFGEYYLPCPSYPTNGINLNDPFETDAVRSARSSWHKMYQQVALLNSRPLPKALKDFFELIIDKSPRDLETRSCTFHEILGDRITVLPPDARHVDYDMIPIVVADGCLYKCHFCMVKSPKAFACRTREDIKGQVVRLREFFERDIRNYNAVFLAQHDALNAGIELLAFAALQAYDVFELERSNLQGSNLFLFGSIDSFLNADDGLFKQLQELPFSTYLNIGMESADPETLMTLKKAITPKGVDEAFAKMLDVNKRYTKIEVTANFLFSNNLPKGHLPAFFRLVEKHLGRFYGKGAIYFSPLINGWTLEKRGIKREFYKIKTRCRLPTFLYLIQRL